MARKIATDLPEFIFSYTINSLIDKINETDEDYEISWNSKGGSVWAGNQFIDFLNNDKKQSTANVTGVAASMGAVMLAFFTKTKGANQADLMIHSAVGGASSTMKATNEFLYKALSKKIDSKKFKESTGKDLKEVMMASEDQRVDVWFTGKQAAYFGLLDESYDLLEKSASIDNKTDFKELGYELPENLKEKYGLINIHTNKNEMEIKDVTASMLLTGNKEAYDSIFEAGKQAEQTRVSEIMKYAQYDMNKANEIVKSGKSLSIADVEHFMTKKFDTAKLNELELGSEDPITPAKPIVNKEAKTVEEKEKEAAFAEMNEGIGLGKILTQK